MITGTNGLLLGKEAQDKLVGILNEIPFKFAKPIIDTLNLGWQDEWVRVSEVQVTNVVPLNADAGGDS